MENTNIKVFDLEQCLPLVKVKDYTDVKKCDESILNKRVAHIDMDVFFETAKKVVNKTEGLAVERYPEKINYIEKQIRNKVIGDTGEYKVVQVEKERLQEANRNDLAKCVHVVESDAYGYDVVSFEEDGTERHIEVKTSTSSADVVSFRITAHEIDTLMKDDKYQLYYLYNINGVVIKMMKFTNEQLRNEIVNKYLKATQYEVNIVRGE